MNTIKTQKTYDIVRQFSQQYTLKTGELDEVIFYNLSWDDAVNESAIWNQYKINDCTDYYFIQEHKRSNC